MEPDCRLSWFRGRITGN